MENKCPVTGDYRKPGTRSEYGNDLHPNPCDGRCTLYFKGEICMRMESDYCDRMRATYVSKLDEGGQDGGE